jgi:hypothetical protein
VADGAALRCFFEGSGAPMSHDNSGGVLQHGRAEGGEGGRLIVEEEGRRVSSPEEGGTVGVAALQPNSCEGRGSRCSSTLWTWVVVLRGGAGTRAAGVWSRKERGCGGDKVPFIGDAVGSGGRVAGGAT